MFQSLFRRRRPTVAEEVRSAWVSTFTRSDDWEAFQVFYHTISEVCRSQIGQDAWALWETSCKKKGYFVEFGAGDGIHLSNTYLLESEFEWNGTAAEPHPDRKQALHESRKCYVSTDCLYSSSGLQVSFAATSYRELSHIAHIEPGDGRIEDRSNPKIVQVQTVTLNDLLAQANAPATIDFMSVDTEGSEYEILKAFDFDRWNVKLIAVEHNRGPARKLLFDLLSARGYRRKWTNHTRFDDWYVRVP